MQDLLLASNLESSNRDGLEPSQRQLFLNIQMVFEFNSDELPSSFE